MLYRLILVAALAIGHHSLVGAQFLETTQSCCTTRIPRPTPTPSPTPQPGACDADNSPIENMDSYCGYLAWGTADRFSDGHDNFQSCALECRSDPKCRVSSWKGDIKKCFIFSSISDYIEDPSYDSAQKSNARSVKPGKPKKKPDHVGQRPDDVPSDAEPPVKNEDTPPIVGDSREDLK